MSKAQRFNFTYRAYGDDPTKIKITNTSIDKQITLKRVILFYFEAHRCSRQTGSVYALRINLLNILIQRILLRGRGTSIINEVTRIE